MLDALNVGVDSQIVVFSKTSLQSRPIQPRNPRVIYFNDSVVVGVGARRLHRDRRARSRSRAPCSTACCSAAAGPPAMFRDNGCLQCHNSFATLGVPGFLAKSVPSAHGRQRAAVARQLPHRSSQPDHRAMGRLVRDRQGRLEPSSGQCAGRRPQHRRRDSRGRQSESRRPALALRYERLSVAAQRRRRAAGVRSPAADDEPADADRLGGAHAGARRPQRGGDRHRRCATPRSRRWTTCCSWTRRRCRA